MMVEVDLQKYFNGSSMQQPKHLSQQQKQLVDILFLLGEYRFHTILIPMHTLQQSWIHQKHWCPIMHGVHVCDQILIDYVKFPHQMERHLELYLATLALNVDSDVNDSVLEKMVETVNFHSAVGSPYMKGIAIGPVRVDLVDEYKRKDC